jgi:hypothetical protein
LKLFALSNRCTTCRYTASRQLPGSRAPRLRTLAVEKTGPVPDITYLRRARASNGLFYVYDRDQLPNQMIRSFLSAKTAEVNHEARRNEDTKSVSCCYELVRRAEAVVSAR